MSTLTSKENHERWLAETWQMIEECAASTAGDKRRTVVSLSPEGCAALLAQRRRIETPMRRFRPIVEGGHIRGMAEVGNPNGFGGWEVDYVLAADYEAAMRGQPPIPPTHETCDQPTPAAVLQWAVDSFGPIASNRDERAARLAEEAMEVAQAEGVPLLTLQKIAERIYSRPVGELGQEVGGLGITLYALAANCGLDLFAEINREWKRVLSKPRDWWQRKHAEKVAAGTADLSPTQKASEPPPTPTMQARNCDYKGPRVERDGKMVCPECGNE